jgi:hypothetical protein
LECIPFLLPNLIPALQVKLELAWFLSCRAILFPLPHDNLGVVERGFSQVVTQLHQLTGLIYQHAIGTFNTCSQRPTHRSLTDTCGGYNFEGADFSHHTLCHSQPMVSTFQLRATLGLKLYIQSLSKDIREGTNHKSREWKPPLDFYRKLSSKHNVC